MIDNIGGLDCSKFSCGKTPMWFGLVGPNHENKAECSNIGYCDGSVGVCTKCGGGFAVFGGDFCEKMTCPLDTSFRACK
jgi:prepilin-type processing-associated H-X9-DG protein